VTISFSLRTLFLGVATSSENCDGYQT